MMNFIVTHTSDGGYLLLNVWRSGLSMTITLTPDEARAIANALSDCADNLPRVVSEADLGLTPVCAKEAA